MPRYTARPAQLAALDVGLRVRLEARVAQRTIFSGAENLSAQELVYELALMVSELRVRSFAPRGQLEQVTEALRLNVRSGLWPLAHHAALDLADLLRHMARRRLADAELCLRGAHCASRIAELLAQEVR
jgi:hypothetical protein